MIENAKLFAVDAPFGGKIDIVAFQRVVGHYYSGEKPLGGSRQYLCLMRALEGSERFLSDRLYQFYIACSNLSGSSACDRVSAKYFHLVARDKEDYLISVHDSLPNKLLPMASVYEKFFDEGPTFFASKEMAVRYWKR